MRKLKIVLFLWLWISFFVGISYQINCKYCNEDFSHVKKHEWRCKVRINRDESIQDLPIAAGNFNSQETAVVLPQEDVINVNDPLQDIHERSNEHSSNTNDADATDGNCSHSYQCYCGRYFQSLRGLNVHRRSCFITEQPYLNDLLVIREPLETTENAEAVDNEEINLLPKIAIKDGVKLPKCQGEWEIANDYFKLHIDHTSEITDVDAIIRSYNDIVYSYFSDTYGKTSDTTTNSDLKNKYDKISKNQLKKSLRNLKSSNDRDLREIKYVSQLLRSKLNPGKSAHEFDHNGKIKENYWKYCKSIFEKDVAVQPSFNEDTCYKYFKYICKEKNTNKSFDLPSWMQTFNDPSTPFNLTAPTYKEIQKIISKMKASGSPCPIDHVSVIALKKCPILRTQLWRICAYCWGKKYFPKEWKNSTTILIHKKGLDSDPSNFRPITLEPVLSKVMTSLIRNRIFTFVLVNNFIENDIQKGFWTGLSGTVEHTELLTYIIRNAKFKQKQLVVTLFDLRNAFGEVHHNLIRKVLEYHHIPLPVSDLVTSLYSDYYISVLTKNYHTHPILVNRGVLQGDCLSPLLFNLCVNTLVECIKKDEVKCLGYVYCDGLLPRHWFQFADDTAIISALNEDNQYLCNSFSKWCTWADLKIRVDKCHTFGIKKSATASIQYPPRIIVNGEHVAPIDQNESFVYLGKEFNFGMNIDKIKDELKEQNLTYVTTIDQLPLTSLNKISIIQQYVYSKYRWIFSIYDLTETWVSENIDSLIGKYLRKWFQLPVSANVQHLSFPTRKLGVSFSFAKTVYIKCKLSVRRILKLSKNSEIRNLFKITSPKNVRSDSQVNSVLRANPDLTHKQVCAKTDRLAAKQQFDSTWGDFMNLKEQNIIIKHIIATCHSKTITMWQKLMGRLPNNIFCFARKALIFCLPNKSNLFRWKLVDNNECSMCKKGETMLHVFSNCVNYLNRYTWRHDSILKLLANKIERSSTEENPIVIYVDCEKVNHRCTSDLFESLRPDLVTIVGNKITVIELTVCFETNTEKSRIYKQNRYSTLKDQLLVACDEFKLIFLEFTTLGFISKQSYTPFNTFLKSLGINEDRTIGKCMETAIRGTYFIFCRRNKVWNEPDLLNFY